MVGPANRRSRSEPPAMLQASLSHSVSRLVLLSCAALGLLATGCIFSPHKGEDKIPPPSYPREISPEIVMKNLQAAYAARDTAKYASLFDDAYTGSSLDNTDTNP